MQHGHVTFMEETGHPHSSNVQLGFLASATVSWIYTKFISANFKADFHCAACNDQTIKKKCGLAVTNEFPVQLIQDCNF